MHDAPVFSCVLEMAACEPTSPAPVVAVAAPFQSTVQLPFPKNASVTGISSPTLYRRAPHPRKCPKSLFYAETPRTAEARRTPESRIIALNMRMFFRASSGRVAMPCLRHARRSFVQFAQFAQLASRIVGVVPVTVPHRSRPGNHAFRFDFVRLLICRSQPSGVVVW
jgi:hypothetical protein